jgi:hypothetical protein
MTKQKITIRNNHPEATLFVQTTRNPEPPGTVRVGVYLQPTHTLEHTLQENQATILAWIYKGSSFGNPTPEDPQSVINVLRELRAELDRFNASYTASADAEYRADNSAQRRIIRHKIVAEQQRLCELIGVALHESDFASCEPDAGPVVAA